MYVSPNGKFELELLRMDRPEPTGGRPPVELLAALPSEECGCPEEIWYVDGMMYLIHFEPDGSGQIISPNGEDEEEEFIVEVGTMNDLRVEMFKVHSMIMARPME